MAGPLTRKPNWKSWTPVLTASTTNPVLGGVGSVAFGRYCKIDRLVVAQFGIRFSTSSSAGRSGGEGIYYVSTPVPMTGLANTAGMSSDCLGQGTLWRGLSGGDIGVGAHQHIMWHGATVAPVSTVLGVLQPTVYGAQFAQSVVTANQTGIAGPTGDLGTNLTNASVTITPVRAGARFSVKAELHVLKESGVNPNMYVQIVTGSTVLRRIACHATILGSAGSGGGLVPINIEYIDDSPTVGVAKSYKIQAFCLDGTMAAFGASPTFMTTTVREILDDPVTSTGDYLSHLNPWEWGLSTAEGGAEIWGMIVGESSE